VARKRSRAGFSFPGWVWLGLIVLTPLVLLNLAVSFFGGSAVSPLSLSFLEQKLDALQAYARHRPACLISGHEPLEPVITEAEHRYRLPAGLLHALVEVESETRPHRISPAGAMGPGQLMPGTAQMLRVEDPFDPRPALDASARYLAEQLTRFDDVRLAVAAYNAGPGAVDGQVPRNGETEFYVVKVMNAYARLRPPPPKAVVASKRAPTAPPHSTPRPRQSAAAPKARLEH
jgi:soluble lytic murein transglycosylase-like protein